jgi:glycosyltransferase involved in cell wall biosynthesis
MLSVVIPCHNVGSYLPDCVQSLRRNTDPSYEFIFVDDASTDDTGELLARLVPTLPGARAIHRPHNGGVSATRNTGLRTAGGRYIAFLDGDDLVLPGHYHRLVRAIDELGVDFVRTDHVRFSGTARTVDRAPCGRRDRPVDPRSAILPPERNTGVDYPYCWAGIFDRRLLDSGLLWFREDLRTCEERPWIWRLHLQAESFAVTGLLGHFYRRNIGTSLTQVADDRQFDFIPAFDDIVEQAKADEEHEALLAKALRSYCALICHHLSRRDRYLPALARELRHRCADALQRLPRAELMTTINGMDHERAVRLRQLAGAA